MRKIAVLLAVCMVVLLAASGCEGSLENNAPISTPAQTGAVPVITPEAGEPVSTEPPMQGMGFASYEIRREMIYYPEGSDVASAEYVLDAQLPYFTDGGEIAASMNDSVAMYREELMERVVSERVPLADRVNGEESPSTLVSCEMEFIGDYLNVGFYEDASYGDSVEHSLYTIAFNRAGTELSLAALTGVFDPSDLATQQVLNHIAKDESLYFGDITAENVKAALDLFNGFSLTENGYLLYAAEGTLGKPELGILSFAVEKSAFYPEFVGDIVPAKHYDALQSAVSVMASACAENYLSFSEGSPDALCATGFLSGILAKDNVKTMTAQEYVDLFSSYFTGAIPLNLSEEGNGTTLENGVYTIAEPPNATYFVELMEARLEGETLTLSGTLFYGEPGAADASPVGSVGAVFITDVTVEMGYKFVEFAIY